MIVGKACNPSCNRSSSESNAGHRRNGENQMVKLGVDIGGTAVKAGLLDEGNRIISKSSFPFPGPSPTVLAEMLRQASLSLLEDEGLSFSDVSMLGAVVPGSIGRDGATVIDAHNLGYHDLPLRSVLQEFFPEFPIRLRNDADGAALAELHCGALRGCRTAVMLTLGTGVGGGIILDGGLFSGGMGRGVELGHMLLVDGGDRCTCGNRGCMEAYCSATALMELGRKACRSHPQSRLARICRGNPDALDARLVVECARDGDPAARDAFDEYLGRLGSACASLFNLLDPEVLAIGGGLSGAGEFLFAPLEKEIDRKCFFRTHGRVVPAQLGNDAGIIGAVAGE